MAPTSLPTLLSPSELSYLHTSLSLIPPIRPDARSPTSFRPLVAETDLLPSANGSARLCFADGTEAIVGVKAEVEKTIGAAREELHGLEEENHSSDDDEKMGDSEAGNPDADLRNETGEDQWIEITIDIPNQRDDDAMVTFLAQMLHEGLIADHTLPNRLIINKRWHWRLYIDILLLSSPSTYPLPLLSLTTHLALLSTHLPLPISSNIEDPLFNDDWDAATPLYPPNPPSKQVQNQNQKPKTLSQPTPCPPITLLITSVGPNIFFDPTHAELAVADSVLAVTVSAPTSSSTNTQPEPLNPLAVRTIDPPSRLSSSAAEAGQIGEDEEGVWKPKKGGMSRGVLGRMVGMCCEAGGVGSEVLAGLEGFR